MRKSCNSSYSLIHLVKIIIRPSVVAHTYSQHSGGTGRWLSVSSRATSNRESPVTKGKKKRINRWEIWPLTMLPTHLWRMPHPLTCRQHQSTSVSKSFRKEKKKKVGTGEMAPWLRAFAVYSRGPGLNSQHSPGDSQWSRAPVRESDTPSAFYTSSHKVHRHTWRQNIHVYNIKINTFLKSDINMQRDVVRELG